MTVENLEENGNQMEENQTVTEENKEEQVVALSIQGQGAKGTTLKLKTDPQHHLPNNRPIEARHLQIVGTFASGGSSRPITKSDTNIGGKIIISGNRPIAAKTLAISETYSVMGNRPVASNQIDDPLALMGYID
jgi:hypothetical protein